MYRILFTIGVAILAIMYGIFTSMAFAQPLDLRTGQLVVPQALAQVVPVVAGVYAPDTIVISTQKRTLTHYRIDGTVRYYRVSVGREGFGWTGTVKVGRMAEWPTWTPPKEMLVRQPYLPKSVPGGINNPLGARALYLHKEGKDTLYRIHGTDQDGRWSIGRAASSGCFRMINADVIELYARVRVGTTVIVQ
jgi:lipoprotein-anchoring transpeptidase ErfK/SrfK